MIKPSTSHHNLNQLSIHNQKHCLVISTQKIATQYLDRFFNDISPSNFKVRKVENKWSIDIDDDPMVNENSQIKKHYDGIDLFLNGKLDKDVIILIRDPWIRFKAALHEDFIKPFTRADNRNIIKLLGMIILKSNQNYSSLKNWIADGYMDVGDDSWNDNEDEEFINSLTEIYKELILTWWISNYSIQDGHNRPYHDLILRILLNNPNKQKVKIFDIDKVNLNEALSKYSVGRKTVDIQNPGGLGKKILTDLLDDSREFSDIKTQVITMLDTEIQSYLTLSEISKLKND
jgi:hypothetical protein|tara:strand:+ start:98 stop:964 length:867 start_codon:yes stop_codon:yes gene_type:complete